MRIGFKNSRARMRRFCRDERMYWYERPNTILEVNWHCCMLPRFSWHREYGWNLWLGPFHYYDKY